MTDEASAMQTGPQRAEMGADGQFKRQQYVFSGEISADGATGYRAAPGRYHLYVQHACPWCHRVTIVHALLGLEDVVGVTVADPIRDQRGWTFLDAQGRSGDQVNGFAFLSEAYLRSDPDYSGRWTVPALWDTVGGRLVSNRFDDMTIMLETAFRAFHRTPRNLYPEELRDEIDAFNARLYRMFNNGVYRAGFASSQAAYEAACDDVFTMMDEMEARLATARYLIGNRLTEADVRAFPTLVRFDAVYHTHFKCNVRRLVDYPHLWAYARDLYQRAAFRDTTHFDDIKRHYYLTHAHINPNGIVPKGPAVDWLARHGREALGPA